MFIIRIYRTITQLANLYSLNTCTVETRLTGLIRNMHIKDSDNRMDEGKWVLGTCSTYIM